MCVAKLTQLLYIIKLALTISVKLRPKQNILERKTCFLFQSQVEAQVSVNSIHNAKLNVKGIELG